ncbi:hypothetical protein FNF27_07090 [Cafeteria roenbergensis]|uniref:Thioredoxin domain-containing protein n=1 Tax=Cafeteria roenbergensis TaxID=33653 RepID=A0A5A8DA13_CAFRO|nr:hypothetical protein FNF31_06780 [Cafeteria roenbergensis]KAA0162383.1 hypothetical protein FNF28_04720 [Cafeteria roenbergensis]KAA0168741.1 hypothetical protein FNF27_07090 [Cafeteria roenbergensis]|mmetsp:Transcript_9308/g.36358  ORF Transcript_9308/g.36358 Transcript_9308/m.36358 type:complete len:542 (-) Transcript_9308:169-1794(-)
MTLRAVRAARSVRAIGLMAALALVVATAATAAHAADSAPATGGDAPGAKAPKTGPKGGRRKPRSKRPPPPPGPDGTGPPGSADVQVNGEIAALHAAPWQGDVAHVAPSDHGAFVRNNENTLVLLTGKGCHLCKRIEREFSRADWLARTVELPVKFAQVETNSEEGTALLKLLNVGALPVMFLNSNKGKKHEFIDEWWSAEPLVADVQRRLGQPQVLPPVRELEAVSELGRWLFDRANDQGTFATTAVAFMPHGGRHIPALHAENEACASVFDNAALNIVFDDEVAFRSRPRFARVTDVEVIKAFGMPVDHASLVVYKDFDEGKAIFNGTCGAAVEDTIDFVKSEATPRVVVANHGNIRDYMSYGTGIIHVFVPDQSLDDPRVSKGILTTMQKLMRSLEADKVIERGEFTLFVSNGHQYHNWATDYGLTKHELPAVGMDVVTRFSRYALPKLSTASIVEPYVPTEAPEDSEDAPTPDPVTGLLPEIPILPEALVEFDLDEIARGVAAVLNREQEPVVTYAKAKKDAAAGGAQQESAEEPKSE